MTQAAVLTGDLIGSTEAGPEAMDRALGVLEDAFHELEFLDYVQRAKLTRFRGDGWQAIVIPAQRYMRVITYVLACLREADIGLETRIGIGIGSVARLGTTNLSDASGMAFIHSGKALDAISGSDRLALEGLPDQEILWHRLGLENLTYLAGRWSIEQAKALGLRVTLQGLPLYKMAQDLDISRQALSSRLAVAGEKPIMAAIRAAEATL